MNAIAIRARLLELAVPAPVKRRCPYGDPYCPCQDGDACHYAPTGPDVAQLTRRTLDGYGTAGGEV